MQSYPMAKKRDWTLKVTGGTLQNICLFGLLYAGLTLLAYLLPTGEFLLRPGAALLLIAGALYGPAVGFGAGLLGGIITDLAQNMLWLHWNIGLGLMGAVFGLYQMWNRFEGDRIKVHASVKLLLIAIAGSFAGMYFAGLVDLILGAPALIAFYAWALPAAVVNALFAVILGIPLVILLQNKFFKANNRK